MYFASKWDWSFADDGAHDFTAHARGFARSSLVGRAAGAVHTELALCRLSPDGWVGRHVHSFERTAYVLGGHPVVETGSERFELSTGDYVLFPVAAPHAWQNPGGGEARWLEVSTPQPVVRDSGREDTYFLPSLASSAASLPDFGNPMVGQLGHYLGTPPQQEALVLSGPGRGRAPAGMDSALLAYSGISVKMLVDSKIGAELLTMFMVDYEPGGAAQVHDHPFEETYFFVEGEIEGEIEGEARTFGAGDVLFCGVGVLHGFFNTSSGRARWIEAQAPQPPRRHSYRWPAHWEHLSAQLGNDGKA